MFKKILPLFTALFLVIGCMKDIPTNSSDTEDYTLVGRWVLVGFEEDILYQFTDTERHTIYASEPGVFGSIEDGSRVHPVVYHNDGSFTINLLSGNSVTFTPEFSCQGRVVDFLLSDGAIHSTNIKENFNTEDCY